ncbi:acylneuraminate cytidylyltransferase family protein [Temperatibacter marinus]|uniref:Acylneuraminate cytidylyltransferase family protein n=1 Tax=Temperatibacter marinus TaxID=1456591 RepID=A0AA52H8X4_9PROT|nr:acylneuraminate cytidylyltransferase family protein [Temperatibacter marinus]WND02571.1 acylneuraminate cytidylyltransferase family protein [Temperatibacter marinus]
MSEDLKPIWAIIPARGGSKGIPKKNIVDLNGMPLIAYSILAARKSGLVDRVIVTSDDDEILEVARGYGAECYKRPAELAQDETTTADSLSHLFLYQLDLPEKVQGLLLQPTSPFRTEDHILRALQKSQAHDEAPIVSVTEPSEHPMKAFEISENGTLHGFWSDQAPYTPRQKLPKLYMPNGAIYIFDVELFMKERHFPRTGVIPYVMSVKDSLDIDTPDDLELAQILMKKRKLKDG